MSLAELSIKRPTFITCVVLLMLAVGGYAIKRLGVDLFPDVTFPVIFTSTPYPGAGPSEIETLISKPIEDELSTISGVKRVTSVSQEGVSTVIAEFNLGVDIKDAEQQIRDRLGSVKRKLPDDAEESVVRRLDPADQPIVMIGLTGEGKETELYDLANEIVRPKIEQVPQVGLVYVAGARKREIKVELDRAKLKAHEISANAVVARLASAGENIPGGKLDEGSKESVIRTLGQFGKVDDIKNVIMNFFGGERSVKISDLGTVTDSQVDEVSRVYLNGQKSLFLFVYKQSGANTIAVTDGVIERMNKINADFKEKGSKAQLTLVRDGSVYIRANVFDVQESIAIGILLAVIVVFFFLGSARSTIITGLALPNSLIGSFILMWAAGYTINLMTLLALSLAVGLLVDDAIVVRENIFRHIENGESPMKAALNGTKEVSLAVIATTLTVIAVFGPVAFLKGVVGQFFKQFGFVICFAMIISLFDALTIAPMLSAYFAGKPHKPGDSKFFLSRWADAFGRGQDKLEIWYEKFLKIIVYKPLRTLGLSFIVALASCSTVMFVPKTFLPPQDAGEFQVAIDLPPGTSLDSMDQLAKKVDEMIRKNPEVQYTANNVGSRDAESNVASIYVKLVPSKQRKTNTIAFKELMREQLKPFAYANPAVKDYDAVGGGQRPFNMNLVSADQEQLDKYASKVLAWLKTHPALKDVDINYRPGKPEIQIALDRARAESLGVSSTMAGSEVRTQIEGAVAAKYREAGREYDVRVRLKEDQRNIKNGFDSTYVPNLNGTLVRLKDLATLKEASGPSKVNRQDRSRYVQVQADISPTGQGMGAAMSDISKRFTDPKDELFLPSGVTFAYVGQAENFKELGDSMVTALLFGVIFIFLVLASLYESFVTPLTIMLALPLAFCGSMVALAITQQSLNIFSMIGVILLLGVAVKNSILLVDYANQRILAGDSREMAIIKAGKTRLRPILMTTMALIAGSIPIAIGLNEASKQRTSMGVAIVGGLISSTLLTLIVVPAAFSLIDRFRIWAKTTLSRLSGASESEISADVGFGGDAGGDAAI